MDFLFETGLRISEAIEVRWGDLDLGRGRLTVSRQFCRGKLGKPKGRKTRTVRLSARMAGFESPRRLSPCSGSGVGDSRLGLGDDGDRVVDERERFRLRAQGRVEVDLRRLDRGRAVGAHLP